MKSTNQVLLDSPLFSGVSEAELEEMLPCLGVRKTFFSKGGFPVQMGDRLSAVGFLVNGEADILQGDAFGNINVVGRLHTGDLFAEVFVCARVTNSPVSVEAITDCEVLFFHLTHLFTSCTNACSFHGQVISNLLQILAEKSLHLNQKVSVISQRTTRDKLITYLSQLQREQKSDQVCLPFNRSKLADYLSVDRSAMSREISKLQREGIVECDRNHFHILQSPLHSSC